MSEQPGLGGAGTPGTVGHGFSAISAESAQAGEDGDLSTEPHVADSAPKAGAGERSSEFGRFDWFAELDGFGRVGRTGDSRASDAHHAAPADGISAAEGAGGDEADKGRWWRRRVSRQWGERQRAHGRRGDAQRGDGWRADRQREARLGRWLRGWRLALAAFGLATTCTLLGGVLGGFVVLHTEGNGLSDSSYSLGTVPPALTNRPAGSVAGIAARDTPAVVMIKVNDGQGTGSGFLIQGGYIVTDNHVVTLDGLLPGASLRVYFSNGRSARAVIVGHDPYSDIAVIRAVGVTNLPALTLGNSAGVAVGDPVIAIGSPLGLADTVTSGIVSAVDRPVQPTATVGSATQAFFDAIQTDAPINPGNSGGPLVNARGQVIGVDAAIDTLGNDPITGTQGGSIGLGFAIPMDLARRVVEELIRTGHATHSVIGATINDNFTGNGAQVMTGHRTVLPGGPAARAGLKPGDIIIKAGSQPVSNAYQLMDAIRSMAPGSHVALTYRRHGQIRQTNLTLGSASS